MKREEDTALNVHIIMVHYFKNIEVGSLMAFTTPTGRFCLCNIMNYTSNAYAKYLFIHDNVEINPMNWYFGCQN